MATAEDKTIGEKVPQEMEEKERERQRKKEEKDSKKSNLT